MPRRRLSITKIRYLGLGTLLVLIALMSLLAFSITNRIEKQLEAMAGERANFETIDRLIGEFSEIRADLTAFVIDESTDVAPLLRQAKEIQEEVAALREPLIHDQETAILDDFEKQIKRYRAAMAAYAQELSLRRTGEGVRSWERTLLEIEADAYHLARALKDTINADIQAGDRAILALSENARKILLVCGTAGVLTALLVALLLQRGMKRPMVELVQITKAVAEGDLTRDLSDTTKDEVARLSQAIADMVRNLRSVVGGIQHTVAGLKDVSGNLAQVSSELNEGADVQRRAIDTAAASVADLETIATTIDEQTRRLSDSLNDSSSSVEEMAAANRESLDLADQLAEEVQTMTSSVAKMNANVGHIAAFLDSVAQSSCEMSQAAQEMAESSSEVGCSGAKATSLAESVRQLAEEQGFTVLERVTNVAQENKALVSEYRELILALGRKSEGVGDIVDVIGSIADQTNLLSLNASIIAAQAGEGGRAFAVVAEEIRSLSQATSSNLQEIGDVVADVQKKVEQAVAMVGKITRGADSNITSVNEVSAMLKQIVTHSMSSVEMARTIEIAAEAQVKRSRAIYDVVGKNASQVLEAKNMMSEQGTSSALILQSVEQVSGAAQHLKASAREQAESSTVISRGLNETSIFAQEISTAMAQERGLSTTIADALQHISSATNETMLTMETLRAGTIQLDALSGRILPAVSHFRLPPEKQNTHNRREIPKQGTGA